MTTSSFTSIDTMCDSWKEQEAQMTDRSHTSITAVSSNTTADGSQVKITVRNGGNTSMANFDCWDVIVRYGEGDVQWLPYSPAAPGWTVSSFSHEGGPEVFDPNILNPGEEMTVLLQLSPPVGQDYTNLATMATPNGVTTSISFLRTGN